MSGLLVWSLGLIWKLLMTLLLFRRGPGHDGDVTVGQGGVEKTTKITDGIILPEDLGRRLDQLAKSIRVPASCEHLYDTYCCSARRARARRWSRGACPRSRVWTGPL